MVESVTSREKRERKERLAKEKAALKAKRADLERQSGSFRIGEKAVSKKQAEQALKDTKGTLSAKDRETIAKKQEATRLGLKGAGEILTPENVEQLKERELRQEEQAPVLEEAGVFEDRPTEQTDLTTPIITQEGFREFEVAAGTELVQQRIVKFGGITGAQQEILNGIQDTVGTSLLGVKGLGEIVGDVPVVGDLITGITGDRGEVVQNVQSSLEARNQMATQIGTLVAEGSMDPAVGFKSLAVMEQNLEADLTLLKREAILSPAVRRSGEIIDIQVDLLELEQEIFDAKQRVAGGALEETDPARILQRIEELK